MAFICARNLIGCPMKVNFPLSLAFLAVNQATNPHFQSFSPVKLIPYDKYLIARIIGARDEQGHVMNDFGRISLRLGTEPKSQSYGDAIKAVDPVVIFAKVEAAAKRNGIELSPEEIQAIFAFCSSVAGETQQGGMFKVLDNMLAHLLNLIGCSMEETQQHHELHVEKPLKSNQIKVVNNLSAHGIAGFQNSKGILDKTPKALITKKSSFIITPINIDNSLFYNLQPLETDTDCMIDVNVWKKCLVPAALTYLDNLEKLSAENLLLTPFLTDMTFRNLFFEKFAKQSKSLQKLALDYIEACFIHDPLTKNGILARPEMQLLMLERTMLAENENQKARAAAEEKTVEQSPSSLSRSISLTKPVSMSNLNEAELETKLSVAETEVSRAPSSTVILSNEVSLSLPPQPERVLGIEEILMNAFQAAKDRLTLIIANENYNLQNRLTAQSILDDIINIPQRVENNNLVLLTSVLERTATAVTNPEDAYNLKKFQELLRPVKIRNWLKLAAGMASMLLGAALVVVAVAVAVASFGATSLLSSWGLAIGSSILVKALSIAVGAGGASILTGGLLLANDRPMAKLLAHSSCLWRTPYYNLPPAVENNSILPSPVK
jgi:hypothetical protein